MKLYYKVMIGINIIILAIVVFNLYAISSEKYIKTEDFEVVDYYDLGCDDNELEKINNTNYFICKDIGVLCEIACRNISDAKVQAALGKGNTVTCRCSRG
ncbi:MAG: hypothetical protein QXK37_00145 [Candidatus Woesearchaeota archaeon]